MSFHERHDLLLIDNCRLDNICLEIVKDGVSLVVGNVYRHPFITHMLYLILLAQTCLLLNRREKFVSFVVMFI